MPKIGEVYWAASVKGVGEASNAADELEGSMDGVAESAIGAAGAQKKFGEETADAQEKQAEAQSSTSFLKESMGFLSTAVMATADAFGVTSAAVAGYTAVTKVATGAVWAYNAATRFGSRWTERLSGDTDRLASSMFFAAANYTKAQVAAWGYTAATTAAAAASTAGTYAAAGLSTALSGVATAATVAWGAIAGPAGLAAGLLLATAGVGLLSTELLGLTDMSSTVEKSNNRMARSFADMAFLVAGPLAGFLIAGFHLITGNWKKAKRTFVNTSVEWAKAAARFSARVQAGLAAFAIAVRTGIAASVEAADYAWRAGWNGILTFTQGIINQISNAVVGGIEGAINSSLDGINGLISKVNEIPRVDVSPVGNVSLGGRNPLDVGAGTVQNEGLDSRLQRVSNRGNRQLRQVAQRGRRQIDRFRPDTISGDRYTRGAKHMGDDGQTQISEQNVNVTVDGSNADLSNLSRGQRKELARLIGEEVGSSVGDTAGGK